MTLNENGNRKFNYEALIRKVKFYPAVFDATHEMHKNRAYVNELWRKIAESLHCSDTLCREKWANLRSNYMRETRKLRIRRVEGKPLKVTWPYFHLLEFLNPCFHRKLSTDLALSMETRDDDERLVIDWKPEATCQETDDDELTISSLPPPPSNVTVKLSPERHVKGAVPNTIERNHGINDNSGKRKRRSCKKNDPGRDLIENLIQRVHEVSNSYVTDKDQDRLFLLSLLPFMKQLNTQENLEFRMEVQQLIQKKLQNKSTFN